MAAPAAATPAAKSARPTRWFAYRGRTPEGKGQLVDLPGGKLPSNEAEVEARTLVFSLKKWHCQVGAMVELEFEEEGGRLSIFTPGSGHPKVVGHVPDELRKPWLIQHEAVETARRERARNEKEGKRKPHVEDLDAWHDAYLACRNSDERTAILARAIAYITRGRG